MSATASWAAAQDGAMNSKSRLLMLMTDVCTRTTSLPSKISTQSNTSLEHNNHVRVKYTIEFQEEEEEKECQTPNASNKDAATATTTTTYRMMPAGFFMVRSSTKCAGWMESMAT